MTMKEPEEEEESRESMEGEERTPDGISEHTLMLDEERVDPHLRVRLPPSLACLSARQLEKADRNATRKLDIMLMPALVVLYILYVLVMVAILTKGITSTGRVSPRPSWQV